MHRGLAAMSYPMARLAAQRTLCRARVTRLDAPGLQDYSCLRRPFSSRDVSKHLIQLRATEGKDLEAL